jgi:hypothetical protein
MKLFTLRTIQNSKIIFVGDGKNTIQIAEETFKKFEPNFFLGENVKEIQYQPPFLLITEKNDGVIESAEENISQEYDIYIGKVKTYINLKQEIDDANALLEIPASLIVAKSKINAEIYQYATSKLDASVSFYSSAERDRWASIILPEAESYLATNDITNTPNLVAQQIIRSGITDTASQEFKNSLATLCNTVIAKNISLTNTSNYIIGVRGKWTDAISSFVKSDGETEQETITRILAIDWKVGWEMPI